MSKPKKKIRKSTFCILVVFIGKETLKHLYRSFENRVNKNLLRFNAVSGKYVLGLTYTCYIVLS